MMTLKERIALHEKIIVLQKTQITDESLALKNRLLQQITSPIALIAAGFIGYAITNHFLDEKNENTSDHENKSIPFLMDLLMLTRLFT